MKPSLLPFNIDLLIPSDTDLKHVIPITVLDITDSASRNFHPQGLFSTEIFGKAGDVRRNRTYSYIDMQISVLHPVLFKSIVDLKRLYGEILAGKTHAVWNTTTKDFVESDVLSGDTGYAFFISHLDELTFEKRPSISREFNIKLVERYRTKGLFSRLIVMPAGIRDYEYDESGKPSEDEINGLYRKVLSISSVIDNVSVSKNMEYLDSARYSLQIAVNNIYDYIKNMMEGKSKFILGKWAARKIFNSTRNVITSYTHTSSELFGDTSVSTNQTVLGLYQYLRTIMPLAVKHVRDTYLADIFVGPNSPAVLVNRQTLKKELVQLDPSYYDDWMTFEGLEQMMAKYGQENLRHDVLQTDTHYFGLIYCGPDGTVKFVQDIDDVPADRDVKDLHPMTFTELLYLSVYRTAPTTPCLITRYPITGYGSIYPSYIYLKTTTKSEVRVELDLAWQPTEFKAVEYPILGEQFYGSIGLSSKHLGRLGADFDGDTVSATCLMSEDAKLEIARKLQSKEYHVNVNGRLFFGANTDVIELVLASMTGDI